MKVSSRTFRGPVACAIAFVTTLALAGCGVPKSAVRDATKHISDQAEAAKAAQALCRTPPAGQDPAQFCSKVDESFDEIKKTSDSLAKTAE